jgi:hypothetical protein
MPANFLAFAPSATETARRPIKPYMAASRPKQRITDSHGNFIEKKRWTKKRALEEAAKKRAAATHDGFSNEATKEAAPVVVKATFGQRKSAMLALLVTEGNDKPCP